MLIDIFKLTPFRFPVRIIEVLATIRSLSRYEQTYVIRATSAFSFLLSLILPWKWFILFLYYLNLAPSDGQDICGPQFSVVAEEWTAILLRH
jgi:hypothetical protein